MDAYEVPERIKEQAALRDGRCVFPWRGPKGTVLLRTNTGVKQVSSTSRRSTSSMFSALRTTWSITERIPPEVRAPVCLPSARATTLVAGGLWFPKPPEKKKSLGSALDVALILDRSAWKGFTPKENRERLRTGATWEFIEVPRQ